MLHRAIFGSLERFFGVYLEHCGGSFPAWLAPKQAIVLTVSEKSDAYARQVVERLRAKASARGRFLERQARREDPKCPPWRYPYMLVVGRKGREATLSGSAPGTPASSAHEARRARCAPFCRGQPARGVFLTQPGGTAARPSRIDGGVRSVDTGAGGAFTGALRLPTFS